MSEIRIPNSFVYKLKSVSEFALIQENKQTSRYIEVKIGEKYYLFEADTNNFTDEEIDEVYLKQQIYINLKMNRISNDFINDYRKLKLNSTNVFEIDSENLFEESEKEVKKILNKYLKGKTLDVGCGDFSYKDILRQNQVDYTGIEIYKIDNGLKIINIEFEKYDTFEKYDNILFLRSINHFCDTEMILKLAHDKLKPGGKLFIVENELFGELKFKMQIFEGSGGDFEHYHNYSLESFKKNDLDKFNIIEESGITCDTANQWYILLQKK